MAITARVREALLLARHNRPLLAARVSSRLPRGGNGPLPESWRVAGVEFAPGELVNEPAAQPMLRAMYRGNYETPTRAVLEQVLRPGGVFIDVGANIGYFSAMAAGLVGPPGQVYAFEPVPRYRDRLEAIAARNPAFNIRVNNWALGAEPGSATIDVAGPRNIGWNSMVPGMVDRAYHHDGTTTPGGQPVAERLEIRVDRLDRYVDQAGIEHIDLIKIDVEGFEYMVLRGMGEVPRRFRPAIICEISPRLLRQMGVTASDMAFWVTSNEYCAVELIAWQPVDVEHIVERGKQANVLLLPAERQA